MHSLKFKKDIHWIGSLDPELRVFDIIMETKFGTTYNSYLVKGSKKTVVFETVKAKCFDAYLEKIGEILDSPKDIDYIVVNHTEPDHAGSIEKMLEIAPHIKIVGSANAIEFLKEITNREFDYIIVEHGDTLDLGNKTLKFISAPFLHWPDSMYTYIPEDKTLVTCDSFGAHYSFDGVLLSKLPAEKREDYMSALLYYFTAIFGPFKNYVLEALDKIKDFDIETVCTGHGPILDENPQEIMEIYRKWSTEENPNKNKVVVIPYVAAYGYTEQLAFEMEKGIKDYDPTIEVKKYNINISNYGGMKTDIMNEIYWADGILLGTSTINGDALPLIWDIAISLNPIVHGGKYVSSFGSYGWSGEGVPNIISRLDQLRMNVLDGYNIKFKPSKDQLAGAYEYGKLFADTMVNNKRPIRVDAPEEVSLEELNPTGEVKKWKCLVCGEVFEGVYPPNICPACGVGQELFEMVEEESVTYSNDTEEKIVVIGNGAAGIAAAEAVRARNTKANIDILTNEDIHAYYRPIVSDTFTEDVADSDFFLKDESWYDEMNINVKLSTIVDGVDVKNKQVRLVGGEVMDYTKLIIASGARSFVPPVANANIAGSFAIRNKKNVDIIKDYAKKCRKAIIIGGGVLGLETAWEMKLLGLDVEIVETATRIFPKQLDEQGSTVLKAALEKAGVTIHTNRYVVAVEGEDKVRGVKLDNDQHLRADIVIMNTGIAPNKEIVENKLSSNRGIVVNERMETSVEGIYACGDCSEFDGKVVGLWQVALEQGKVAGANAVGDTLVYKDEIQPVTFSGMNMDVFSMGDIDNEYGDYQVMSQVDVKNNQYKKLYFDNEKLVGGILLGDVSKANVILKGVRDGYDTTKVLKKLYK